MPYNRNSIMFYICFMTLRVRTKRSFLISIFGLVVFLSLVYKSYRSILRAILDSISIWCTRIFGGIKNFTEIFSLLPQILCNKFVRTEMRPKEGTKIELQIFVRFCQICQICRFRFVRCQKTQENTRERRTDGRTDRWTDGQTDGMTDGWTDGQTDQ